MLNILYYTQSGPSVSAAVRAVVLKNDLFRVIHNNLTCVPWSSIYHIFLSTSSMKITSITDLSLVSGSGNISVDWDANTLAELYNSQ